MRQCELDEAQGDQSECNVRVNLAGLRQKAGIKPAFFSLVAMAGILLAVQANAELEEGESLRVFIGDHFSYDENLYRLADGEDLALQSTGATASRDDYINRISLGMEGEWEWSRQKFDIAARVDDSRYQNNSNLDNTTGNAKAHWAWRFGENLSGQLGADYNRFLAGFTNSEFRERDVLETNGEFWNAMLTVGPHWRLKAGARHAATEHGAPIRRVDNYAANSGTFGIDYETSASNTFGWDYRYTKADFDRSAILDGFVFDRNYDEHTSSFRTRYALTQKTALQASVGYLRREYPAVSDRLVQRGNFSGSVWDASLQWRPSGKTSLNLRGWRALRAYIDAESDYFVAQGFSVTPAWSPTVKLTLQLEYSREDQDYLGAGVTETGLDRRNERVTYQQFSLQYKALKMLQFELSGRLEKRDSDRPLRQFDDRIAAFGVRFVY